MVDCTIVHCMLVCCRLFSSMAFSSWFSGPVTLFCSEARNVLRPWHFSLNFDALGWLLTDPVAMVSAKCCLSYGECAKVCFRGVLKPQNVFKMCWRPFCFHKIWWKYTLKPQKRRIVRLALGRGENSLVFYGFLYSSIWLNFVIFCTDLDYLPKLWLQKQMVHLNSSPPSLTSPSV